MDKENTINVIKEAINNMDKKEFSIHFFTMDTQGNPVARVANIYEHVRVLRSLGYNANILHEKNNYTPVNWLGEEYTKLPHISVEAKSLQLKAEDVIIIPENYANVMEQLTKVPGYKVVFCQAYDSILELLPPGKSWRDYGIDKCITTTEKQKEYISNLFSNTIDIDVIPVGIDDYFKPSEKDKKPIVSVLARNQDDLIKIFKSFYLKYPHLKWITFRDMRGLPKEIFAKDLAESCLAVWVDDIAGFGTFPLEAMKCNVPVLAKIPNIVPEYFTEKNGLWVHDVNSICDLISNYVQAWLEDSEPAELYDEMAKLKDTNTMSQMEDKVKEIYEKIFNERKQALINSQPIETELEGEVIEMDNVGTENK